MGMARWWRRLRIPERWHDPDDFDEGPPPSEAEAWRLFCTQVEWFGPIATTEYGLDVDLGDGQSAEILITSRHLHLFIEHLSAGAAEQGRGSGLSEGLPLALTDGISDCLGSQSEPHAVYALVGWDLRKIR